jgi:hypothetical protein
LAKEHCSSNLTPHLYWSQCQEKRENVLEVEVTGTSANRIRDLDLRSVKWRNFHDANVLNTKYAPFDSSAWPVAPQGLLGPVILQTRQ